MKDTKNREGKGGREGEIQGKRAGAKRKQKRRQVGKLLQADQSFEEHGNPVTFSSKACVGISSSHPLIQSFK